MTGTLADSIQTATAWLARTAIMIAGASLIGMAGVEAWQVFARYVLNASPGWTEPVALLLLVTAMSLGAAAGVRSAAHFGFFIVAQRSPPAVQRVLRVIAQLVVAAVGVLLAWWGAKLFVDGLDVTMAGAAMPQSMPFLPLTVSGLLMAIFAIERLLSPPSDAAHEPSAHGTIEQESA